MMYVGPGANALTDEHEGFVGGRFPDGSLSDMWTDITQCDDGTVREYVSCCECGWVGGSHPADSTGYADCEREWQTTHFRTVLEQMPEVKELVGAGADRTPASFR